MSKLNEQLVQIVEEFTAQRAPLGPQQNSR
jgi:hypothetical protein